MKAAETYTGRAAANRLNATRRVMEAYAAVRVAEMELRKVLERAHAAGLSDADIESAFTFIDTSRSAEQ